MGIFKKSHKNSLTAPSEPSQDYWIDQILDHFDPLNRQNTFKQRFWMNDTYADGKSLLFAFGGEAPLQEFYGVLQIKF